MSYDVALNCPHCKEPLTVDLHSEGGTYVVGGTYKAELNVTYNYSKHFSVKKALDGKQASEVIPVLREAVAALGTERAADYWEPTEGNVGYMASILLQWAEQHPEGVFTVV